MVIGSYARVILLDFYVIWGCSDCQSLALENFLSFSKGPMRAWMGHQLLFLLFTKQASCFVGIQDRGGLNPWLLMEWASPGKTELRPTDAKHVSVEVSEGSWLRPRQR